MKSDNQVSTAKSGVPGSRLLPFGEKRSDKALKLSLEAGRFGGAVVLHCQGQGIFCGEARALTSIISDVLPSARRMVVDLAGVLSLDTEALGELVLTNMWADAAGYELKFSSPSQPVRRLLESTNLISIFDVYASATDAMAAMHHEEVHSA